MNMSKFNDEKVHFTLDPITSETSQTQGGKSFMHFLAGGCNNRAHHLCLWGKSHALLKPLEVGMPFRVRLFSLLKVQKTVWLALLLWWELGTNFLYHRSWWMNFIERITPAPPRPPLPPPPPPKKKKRMILILVFCFTVFLAILDRFSGLELSLCVPGHSVSYNNKITCGAAQAYQRSLSAWRCFGSLAIPCEVSD